MGRIITSQRRWLLLLCWWLLLVLWVAVLHSAPPHPRAMLADAGNTIDASHNVTGKLCHEEHVAVRHDGDGTVAHNRIIVAN